LGWHVDIQVAKMQKSSSTICTDNSSGASVSVLQRPTSNEFSDALSAQSTSKCDVNVLPTKLQPVKIEDENDKPYFSLDFQDMTTILCNSML
jgi:hypothetical protein